MNKLFQDFDRPDKETWKQQFLKDLKGQSHELLEFKDSVEEIEFTAYYHSSDQCYTKDEPGNYPYQRGINRNNNTWNNIARVAFSNEKTGNEHALRLLMSGADGLWFSANQDEVDMTELLNDVQLEYIRCQFDVVNLHQLQSMRHFFKHVGSYNVSFNYDALSCIHNGEIEQVADTLRDNQIQALMINGFALQQTGASAIEEIAFCLSVGHETLVRLMQQGLNIDQAAACIHFHVGAGSDYFLQTAKIKALKGLWSKVIKAYSPQHDCTYNITITVVTGHMNKSLADPYSNLLRQTTEAMSSISAGIESICILPYDLYSGSGPGELAGRMALNIPLILKEESYFDMVIDPTGGSYSLDHLIVEVSRKGWNLFRAIESDGGIARESCLNSFVQRVKQTQKRRLESILNNKQTLIGINKYMNPDKKDVHWNYPETYLGLDPLIIEVELNKVENEG